MTSENDKNVSAWLGVYAVWLVAVSVFVLLFGAHGCHLSDELDSRWETDLRHAGYLDADRQEIRQLIRDVSEMRGELRQLREDRKP